MLYIDKRFDIDLDNKLGRKSLLLSYLELSLNEIEADETINTINILIDEINEGLHERLKLPLEYRFINPELAKINFKTIFKLIESKLILDGTDLNKFDLTYEQTIMTQIYLAKRIAELNPLKDYYVICDIPYLNANIQAKISHELTNLSFLVFIGDKYSLDTKLLVGINDKIIDFGDEIQVYNELVLEYPAHITIDEVNTVLTDYLSGKTTDSVERLKSIF